MEKPNAILMGPCVGELYWEAGRFAPMLTFMVQKEFRGRKDIAYIILSREDRFDLYGRNADILVPLRINNDYEKLTPECFRLLGFSLDKYQEVIKAFRDKYSTRFHIIKHIYPDISKKLYANKNQFPSKRMIYNYYPRRENYDLVEEYVPNNKPLVILASRFRNGFKRNWKYWYEFYDLLWSDKLLEDFNFIICGKKGEYIPDKNSRFLDINNIELGSKSSLIGLLLVILEKAFFTFGSQSAIPNLSLLYGVDVLEFGCQKTLHTVTYNIKKTPITYIDNPRYDLDPKEALRILTKLLRQKEKKR